MNAGYSFAIRLCIAWGDPYRRDGPGSVRGETLEDTWGPREMPVLNAVVALMEHSYMVTVTDIAERTGLELAEVARSLDTLDPTYVDFRKTETGGDPRFWYVLKVTPEARHAVGQWPTADSLVDRFAQAFRDAAENEDDPERHYQLRQAAGLLGGGIRDIAIQIAADITGLSTAGPSATGPSAARPSATEPSATGPSSAGPSATGPATGPSATGPSATGPSTTEPSPDA